MEVCSCSISAFGARFQIVLWLTLSFCLERIEHIHNVSHFSKAICYASGHCGADFECLVQPNEIVIHRVKRDRARVIFNLFAECVCQSRKAPHMHPHRKILAFCMLI
jgi:hypothetical protein